jgi:hypothetical protein
MMRRHGSFGWRARQGGAATLLLVLGVLVMLTAITIVSGEIATVEQRTAGNELRGRQAFEAAMTGYERALAHVTNPANATAPFDFAAAPPNAAPRVRVTEQDVRHGTYAVEFCDASVVAGALQNPLPAPTVGCTPGTPGDDRRLIYARGWSDDGSGLHHVVAVVEKAPAFGGTPSNPLTAKGSVSINGSADVTNPEGRLTIWAGNSVPFSNANFKTNILSPSGQGEVIEGSSSRQAGIDVVANDGNLSNESDGDFFRNFMGYSPSAYRAAVGPQVITDGDLGSAEGSSPNSILWLADSNPTDGIKQDFSLNGGDFGLLPVGTPGEPGYQPAKPTVIIVDGNFDVAGNVTINGLLYVRGNLISHGNVRVNGSVIVEGRVENGTGSLDIVYNSLLLGAARGLGRAAVLPGSWKDWVQLINGVRV